MRVQFSESEEGLLISKLFIQNISMADNGTYLCIAMNKFGSSNSEFVLHVTNNVKECFKLIINLHNISPLLNINSCKVYQNKRKIPNSKTMYCSLIMVLMK